MGLKALLLAGFLLCSCLLLSVSAAEDRDATAQPRPAAASSNSSSGVALNSTQGSEKSVKDLFDGMNVDSSMFQRALYVLIGFTMVGVLYFLVRAVRLKKPSHRKKYGLLADYNDSVEMDAMESDEDNTLYEARSLRR